MWRIWGGCGLELGHRRWACAPAVEVCCERRASKVRMADLTCSSGGASACKVVLGKRKMLAAMALAAAGGMMRYIRSTTII